MDKLPSDLHTCSDVRVCVHMHWIFILREYGLGSDAGGILEWVRED